MMSNIFNTKSPIIGMIHFMPLIGYPEYPGFEKVLKKAKKDVQVLKGGGVDGIIVENNYDIPHKIFVEPETIACMTLLVREIVKSADLPMGVNVLWNDYKASLSIAKLTGAKFIRVPVLVDNVKTNYGDIFAEPEKVFNYRKKIKAEEIFIFADIQVKHAEMLEEKELVVSAKEAIAAGANALIVTGKWTGNAPLISDLEKVREAVGDFPVLVGSGAKKENIALLLRVASGVIVGTALKSNYFKKDKTNIKSYQEVIEEKKVKEFIRTAKNVKIGKDERNE